MTGAAPQITETRTAIIAAMAPFVGFFMGVLLSGWTRSTRVSLCNDHYPQDLHTLQCPLNGLNMRPTLEHPGHQIRNFSRPLRQSLRTTVAQRNPWNYLRRPCTRQPGAYIGY